MNNVLNRQCRAVFPPSARRCRQSAGRPRSPASCPPCSLRDLGHRCPELLAVLGCQRRQELAEFCGHLSVERGRCLAAGVGEHDAQGAPVTWHRCSFGQAPSFGSVDEAGECGLFDAAAACQVRHAPRALGQDAQQPGLDGVRWWRSAMRAKAPCTRRDSWTSRSASSSSVSSAAGGCDLHKEFLKLLPERPHPISTQRWSVRRVGLLLGVLVLALLALLTVFSNLRSAGLL
jgi:hypothetical protein